MPISNRVDALAYLVGFLATVTVPVQDPRGMGALKHLQPLKASVEGAATLVREFCLRKREVETEPTFTRMLAQFFN